MQILRKLTTDDISAAPKNRTIDMANGQIHERGCLGGKVGMLAAEPGGSWFSRFVEAEQNDV
jgi:hypothetical protein